jgi:alkylhydroperoxidase family enzyme
MSRLEPRPDREAVAEDERADYDAVMERTERVHGLDGVAAKYFGALAHTPPLAAVIAQYGTRVRQGQLRGTYTDAERELMDLALAHELGSSAILPIHVPDAVAVGVRPAAVEAVLAGDDAALTGDERQLVEYARSFARGAVDDEQYARIRERFGPRGAVEFTVLLGFLTMTIRLWQALGVPEPTPVELEALLRSLRDGTLELPDAAARIG